MKPKHPAIKAYEDLFALYTGDNPPGIPYAGDPVGRARLEAEWARRGIEVPSNIVAMWDWWIKIGGLKRARQLCRAYEKAVAARDRPDELPNDGWDNND